MAIPRLPNLDLTASVSAYSRDRCSQKSRAVSIACSVVTTVPSGYTIPGPVSCPGFRTMTSTAGTERAGEGLCDGHPAGRVPCLVAMAAHSNVLPSHSKGVHTGDRGVEDVRSATDHPEASP